MPLNDKKFVDIYNNANIDKVKLKDISDAGYLGRIATCPDEEPNTASLIYHIGLIQEELNELRRYLTDDVGDGAAGAVGDRGGVGDRGIAGADGADGVDGADGADGADGVDGARGAAGAAGARGTAGSDGADGADGSTPTITDLNGDDLPTSSRGLSSGDLYNNRGTIRVV
jgi:hypothetical protein